MDQTSQQPQAPAAPESPQAQPPRQDPSPVQDQSGRPRPVKTRNDPANPLSPAAMAAKKAQLLEMLREDRGVAPPSKPVEQPPTPKPDAPMVQPAPPSEAQRWLAEIQAQQKAAQEAAKAAEQRQSELAAKEAAAEAKLKKLELSLSNPLEFIAEAGMTPEQWTEFLTGDGKLTPEQKRVREAENLAKQAMERAEALEKRLADERKQMQAQAERSQIEAQLAQFPLTKRMGGAEVIQNRVAQLSQQTGQPVSWQQAAQALENEFFAGLNTLLQDSEIAGKLNLGVSKPQSDQLAAPTSPTTLGRATAPTSGAGSTTNPRDWVAKKAAYLALMKKQGQ